MLKIHMRDWDETVPDGSMTRRGNEKTIVKKIIKTPAKLSAGKFADLFWMSFRLNILHASLWMIG